MCGVPLVKCEKEAQAHFGVGKCQKSTSSALQVEAFVDGDSSKPFFHRPSVAEQLSFLAREPLVDQIWDCFTFIC